MSPLFRVPTLGLKLLCHISRNCVLVSPSLSAAVHHCHHLLLKRTLWADHAYEPDRSCSSSSDNSNVRLWGVQRLPRARPRRKCTSWRSPREGMRVPALSSWPGVKICRAVLCSFYSRRKSWLPQLLTINSFEEGLCMWGNFKFKVKWVAFCWTTGKRPFHKRNGKKDSFPFIFDHRRPKYKLHNSGMLYILVSNISVLHSETVSPADQLRDHKYTPLFIWFSFSVLSF